MLQRKRIIIFCLAVLSISLIWGNGGGEEPGQTESAGTYFVSILPQAYLLERIGGDRIQVSVMVPPGKSPATYEPTPRQVMELGGAELFFTIGVPFERNFLHSIEETLPGLEIVDSSEGIERRHLEAHHHDEEDEEAEHNEEGEEEHHEEGAEDPHIWLSPVLMEKIAENMAGRLIARDPEGKEAYEANLASLLSDLDALDGELKEILAPLKGETLFVYHPSFGYFGDRYGLEQEAIETGGKEPSPADLENIISLAREEGVHIILVQPEFSQSSAKAVAQAIGGAVVTVEPLNRDYINNLKNLAAELKKGLQ